MPSTYNRLTHIRSDLTRWYHVKAFEYVDLEDHHPQVGGSASVGGSRWMLGCTLRQRESV